MSPARMIVHTETILGTDDLGRVSPRCEGRHLSMMEIRSRDWKGVEFGARRMVSGGSPAWDSDTTGVERSGRERHKTVRTINVQVRNSHLMVANFQLHENSNDLNR